MPPVAAPAASREWSAAFECACQFWGRVRVDTRISEPFRRICVENLATLECLKTAPRLL